MAAIPKFTNTDMLPIRQIGNGTWQLRKRVAGGKRVEVALGTKNRAVAIERASRILAHHIDTELHEAWSDKVREGLKVKGWLWRMRYNMHSRAALKGFACDITDAMLEILALRTGGRCEVSKIPFYLGKESRHPFKPSIDRIDSKRGYEADNVRMVCLSVNMCMAQWGDAVFHRIAAATVAARLEKMAEGGEKYFSGESAQV